MSLPIICCPHCGSKIEIAAREVQVELPLGPLSVSLKPFKENSERNVKRLAFTASDEDFLSGSGNVERSILDEGPIDPSSLFSCSEQDFLEMLQRIVGEAEIKAKGGLWRYLFRQDRRAMSHAFEDWKLRTPDQQREIKNRPAWLTDRYKRARDEITKARQVASG